MLRIILLVIFCAVGNVGRAHISVQVGVDSNLLVDGDRVVFAQSDGSLTALSIEDGKVLQREKSRDFSGTFQRIPEGLLMLQYGKIALLNPVNFAVIWETQSHYEANVLSDSLVSYDGYGVVECRSLADGSLRWKYSLPGALQVIAIGDRVLIHRGATYDDSLATTTVLLDSKSGEELLRKHPSSGIHWPEVFFDGKEIYLKEGVYVAVRSEYSLNRLVVWNLQGEELRSIPLTQKQRNDLQLRGKIFELENKAFQSGRIYPDKWTIPRKGFAGFLAPKMETDGISGTHYNLGDGYVLIERDKIRKEPQESEPDIALRSPSGIWKGKLPYLPRSGQIVAIALSHGRLLIGTNFGHVECINAATGESLWLYVFPTMLQTMSFSANGMPPMMSQAAAAFSDQNKNPPSAGMTLLGEPARSTRVILDPEPANPFSSLPRWLAVAWGGSVLPLFALVCIHVHPRTRMRNLAIVSAILVITAFACFLFYGRVSPGSSIAMRIVIAAGLVIGTIDTVKSYRRGNGWNATIALGLLIGIAFEVLPYFTSI